MLRRLRRAPSQWLRLTIGLGVGVAAGTLALWDTRPENVWSILQHASPWAVIVTFLLVALTQWIKVVRWQTIAGGRDELPAGLAWRALLVGQAINLLLPARVGDVARVLLAGRRTNGGAIYTFYTVLVEKFWEVCMLLACLSLLLTYGPWPQLLSRWGIVFSLLSLAGLGAILGAVWVGHRRPTRTTHCAWVNRFLVPTRHLGETLLATRRNGGLAKIAMYSAAVWLLGLLTNWTAFAALDVSVHWSASLLVLVAIYVGVVLPSPPGRVGLFHYAVKLALGAYGVPDSQALACGVLLHSIVIVPLLLAGGVAALVGQGAHG